MHDIRVCVCVCFSLFPSCVDAIVSLSRASEPPQAHRSSILITAVAKSDAILENHQRPAAVVLIIIIFFIWQKI